MRIFQHELIETQAESCNIRRMTKEEFATAVEKHHNEFYNFALVLTNDQSNAMDVLQLAYMKAIRHLDQYQDGTNLKAWMNKIIRNTYIDEYRKKKITPAVGTEEDSVELAAVTDEEAIISAATAELVRDALNQLDPDDRSIIHMRELMGFRYSEIAQTLDIPQGTVMSRLHRARLKLKEAIIRMSRKNTL